MSTNLAYLQLTFFDHIMNKMELDINMFSPFFKYLIFGQVNSTLNVTVKIDARINSTQLIIQAFQPN